MWCANTPKEVEIEISLPGAKVKLLKVDLCLEFRRQLSQVNNSYLFPRQLAWDKKLQILKKHRKTGQFNVFLTNSKKKHIGTTV